MDICTGWFREYQVIPEWYFLTTLGYLTLFVSKRSLLDPLESSGGAKKVTQLLLVSNIQMGGLLARQAVPKSGKTESSHKGPRSRLNFGGGRVGGSLYLAKPQSEYKDIGGGSISGPTVGPQQLS